MSRRFPALLAATVALCLSASSAFALDLCSYLNIRYLNAHTGQQWTRSQQVTVMPAGETLRCELKAGTTTVQVRILKAVGPAAPQKSQFEHSPRIPHMGPAAWFTRTPDLAAINQFSYGAVRFASGYVYIVEGIPPGSNVENAYKIAWAYIKTISPR